jgi:hypothetical protein
MRQWVWLVLASVAVAAGCKETSGGEDRSGGDVVGEFSDIADAMCRCTDKPCAEKVNLRFEAWLTKNESAKGSYSEQQRAKKIAERYTKCMMAAMGAGGSAPTPESAPVAPSSTAFSVEELNVKWDSNMFVDKKKVNMELKARIKANASFPDGEVGALAECKTDGGVRVDKGTFYGEDLSILKAGQNKLVSRTLFLDDPFATAPGECTVTFFEERGRKETAVFVACLRGSEATTGACK